MLFTAKRVSTVDRRPVAAGKAAVPPPCDDAPGADASQVKHSGFWCFLIGVGLCVCHPPAGAEPRAGTGSDAAGIPRHRECQSLCTAQLGGLLDVVSTAYGSIMPNF